MLLDPVKCEMAFYIQSVHSGLYLDVKSDQESAGVEVIAYAFHGKKNQQWKYNNGMLFSKLNNLVLDVDSNDRIVMVEPSGTEKQKWHFDDDFTIRNEDGMVLDVQKGSKEAGTKVIAFKKHGGPNQKFRVVPINKIK